MKKIILGFILLSSMRSYAQKISYTNVPVARIVVKTSGEANAPGTFDKHRKKTEAALDDLRAHIENHLQRKILKIKCEKAQMVVSFSEQGLVSECSASFI